MGLCWGDWGDRTNKHKFGPVLYTHSHHDFQGTTASPKMPYKVSEKKKQLMLSPSISNTMNKQYKRESRYSICNYLQRKAASISSFFYFMWAVTGKDLFIESPTYGNISAGFLKLKRENRIAFLSVLLCLPAFTECCSTLDSVPDHQIHVVTWVLATLLPRELIPYFPLPGMLYPQTSKWLVPILLSGLAPSLQTSEPYSDTFPVRKKT